MENRVKIEIIWIYFGQNKLRICQKIFYEYEKGYYIIEQTTKICKTNPRATKLQIKRKIKVVWVFLSKCKLFLSILTIVLYY